MNEQRNSYRVIMILAVTLAGILFGSAESSILRASVFALMAAMIFVAPPQFRHNRWLTGIALLALLLPCIAFLPADWFGMPAWKTSAKEIGINLPATVSPQPWRSVEALCLLASGLAWLYYLSSLRWTRSERAWLCRGVALGSILIAGLYCFCKFTSTPWIGAIHEDQFGPFPNKNQTASVLLVGAILTIGWLNLPGSARRKQKLAWAVGLLVLLVGFVAVGSRTGLVLFVAGALAVSARRATLPKLAIACSVALLGATALIISDADIVKKFSGEKGVIGEAKANGRWDLYADSWKMTSEAPLTGVGIGNFADVFALHRERSAAANRALHPDSDFFWMVAEIGLPASLAILAFVVGVIALALVRKAGGDPPSRRDTSLRMTCFIAATAFVINSIVDVPAHRIGALLPGVLVLALAIPSTRGEIRCTRPLRWSLGFCAASPVLALLLVPRINQPLDAQTYFADAQTQLELGEITEARRSFEKARFLRPDNIQLPIDEGSMWLANGLPSNAIAAWREAIARGEQHGDIGQLLHQMFKLSGGNKSVREDLWLLAAGKPKLQVVALDRIAEKNHIVELLQDNPDLDGWNHTQIKVALASFAKYHSDDELLELVERHPDWAILCWEQLSEGYARKGDHTKAFQIISSACPPPDLSILQTTLSLEALSSHHLRAPQSLTPAIRLAHMHMRRGNQIRALKILRAINSHSGETPPIVQFMIAHCLAQQASHREALEAMLSYVEMLE